MFNAQFGRGVLFALPFATTLAIGTLMPAYAADLGVATKYNVFVFGDMNQSSDSEGRVAVGGNATFSNFGIGDRLSNSGGSDTRLVVGGNLNYNGGQVFGGNAVYGGTATLTGGASANNGSFVKTSSPIDFNAAKQELNQLSSDLGGIATTGTTTYQPWGGIQLSGSKPDINVFTLDGSKFSSTNSFSLNAPAGSTVIVNVTGDNISLQNFGMQFSGVDKKNVVFNFVNATSLTTTNFSFQGSVLAPKASYKFNNGNLEGTLIANSVSGTGEFHNYTFSGNLPSTSPSSSPSANNPSPSPSPSAPSEPVKTPEPFTIVGTMLGGAALSFWRRQRKG